MRYIVLETWPELEDAHIVPDFIGEDEVEMGEENAIFGALPEALKFAETCCQRGVVLEFNEQGRPTAVYGHSKSDSREK